MSGEQELKTSSRALVYKSIKGNDSADFEINFGLVDQLDHVGDIARESTYEVGERVKIGIGHIRSDADEMKIAGIGEVTERRGDRMICKGKWLDTPLGQETRSSSGCTWKRASRRKPT